MSRFRTVLTLCLLAALAAGCPGPLPPPVVTPPTMRAVTVAVHGTGGPLAGAAVVLDDVGMQHTGTTGADGRVVFTAVPASLADSHLWVTAPDYRAYDAHVDVPAGAALLEVTLTAAEPPPDPLVFRSNFCNLRDKDGNVVFTSSLAALPLSQQEEWIALEKANGGTHYVFSIESGYRVNGVETIPTVNFFTSGRMTEWLATFDRVVDANLVPVVFLHSGGRSPAPTPQYFRDLVAAIPSAYHTKAIWVVAWEPVPGDWTSRELKEAADAVRASLQPGALMALHLGVGRLSPASHPGEPDDHWRRWCVPVDAAETDWHCYDRIGDAAEQDKAEHPHPRGRWQGDEIVPWRTWGWKVFDIFLYQTPPFRPGMAWDVSVSDSEAERAVEVATRVLGTHVAGAPDWFDGLPRRPVLVAFETVAYFQFRNQGDSAFARQVADWFKSAGYQGFGNGLPHAVPGR